MQMIEAELNDLSHAREPASKRNSERHHRVSNLPPFHPHHAV